MSGNLFLKRIEGYLTMNNNSEVKIVKVAASKSYEVIIGKNLINKAGQMISSIIKPCKVAVVTDDTVDGLYYDIVSKSLKDSGYEVVKFTFIHGEESKNLITYGKIVNFLAESGLTRTDALVALGGGVVGDMAGFAAATFLRGIKYIQIPTTLLSQIDSSVGGKTAIDLPSGKNLVGAFCQPSLVICDVDTLKTLPEKIFIDGMGEVVKYAVLDEDIFKLIEGEYDICDLVYKCVDYKRRIVEADEFEGGVRKLLNLGHTPAHGIEKLSKYSLPHGNAVAMGMEIIAKNSLRHQLLSSDDYQKIIKMIKACVGDKVCPYDVNDVMDAAKSDKKINGDTITLLMIEGIGKVVEKKISVNELRGYIQ